MVRAQLAFGASEPGQVLPVKANAVPLVPLPTPMVLKVAAAVPVLVTVRVCGALVDPAFAEKAVRDENESAGAGTAVPVPSTPTLWVTAHGRSEIVKGPVNYDLFKQYLDALLK